MSTSGRVLVVDDDALQIELVERALSRDGIEVRGVSNVAGISAEAKRFAPDVVLLDVNMPEASSGDALALAKAAAPNAKFVLYSASDPSKLRALAAKLAVEFWISKSESLVEIARRIKELVSK